MPLILDIKQRIARQKGPERSVFGLWPEPLQKRRPPVGGREVIIITATNSPLQAERLGHAGPDRVYTRRPELSNLVGSH